MFQFAMAGTSFRAQTVMEPERNKVGLTMSAANHGSILSNAQTERARSIGEARGIDDQTARQLVYLQDLVATIPPSAFAAGEVKRSRKTDTKNDPAFRRLADDVARGVYAHDPEFFLKDLNALLTEQAVVKRKSKKIQIEEALRRSDLSAQIVGRTDVEYGPHDCLPRGEHVARMRKD